MVTFKIEIGKPLNDGTRSLYIRVTKNREMRRLRFFMNASPEDIAGGTVVNPRLDMMLNDTISSFKHKLYDAGFSAASWSVDEVVKFISGEFNKKNEPEFKLDFIAFGRKHVQMLKNEDRLKTAEGYSSALNNFAKFLGKESIDINEINKAMLLRYKEWFEFNKFGSRAFEMYMGNLKTLHENAKQLYNDEDDEKLNIKLSPFKTIQFRRSAVEKRDVEKRAISSAALKYLWDVPTEGLSRRALMARDAFFLSFSLCGMNAVDMWKHTTVEDSEEGLIEYSRSKTVRRSGTEAYIRMHLDIRMKEVSDRNKGRRHTWNYAELYSTSNTFNKALNVGLSEFVNEALVYYGNLWNINPVSKEKQLLKKLELPSDKELTFYAARHSFATIAANDCHVPTETIDRCLCHVVNSVAAASYIKKDYRYTDDTIAKVMDFVFGK